MNRVWTSISGRVRSYPAHLRSSRSISTSSTTSPLLGTAPQYQRHLILLTNKPVESWPSNHESVSALVRELTQRKNRGAFDRMGITFAEDLSVKTSDSVNWSEIKSQRESAAAAVQEEESYSAFLYPDFIPIPHLAISSIDAFEQLYLSLPSPSTPVAPSPAHLFVCTHGSRDCRCSDIGQPLYEALVKEKKRQGLSDDALRLFRIAHVGGHKYAANALMYKQNQGDWYGQLRASDAKSLISFALSSSSTPLLSAWRGRLGLSPAETETLYAASLSIPIDPTLKAISQRHELGAAVTLTFQEFHEDEPVQVIGYEGESLMEVGKRAGFETIEALCGGVSECATCHVHLIPPDASLAPLSPISAAAVTGEGGERIPIPVPIESAYSPPPISEEEEDQLEFAMGRREDSRLSCQIRVEKGMEGWTIGLPRH